MKVDTNIPKNDLPIINIYPFQYAKAETRVQKIKEILNTIELKHSRDNFSNFSIVQSLDKSSNVSSMKGSEIFFIDWNKLDHSISSNKECSTFTINPTFTKYNFNSLKDERSSKIQDEIKLSSSFNASPLHIQNIQFLNPHNHTKNSVGNKHYASPNKEVSNPKMLKHSISKYSKSKKISAKKRLVQALLGKGRNIEENLIKRRIKLNKVKHEWNLLY